MNTENVEDRKMQMLIWRHVDLKPDDLPEAFIDFLRHEGVVKELTPHEIRNMRDKEKERLPDLVDDTEKACCLTAIATMDAILND